MKELFTQADILAFLNAQRMQELQVYLSRGRRFQSLSDDDLKTQWKNLFKAFADDPADAEIRASKDDSEAELAMRNIDLPMDDEAEAAFGRLQEKVEKHFRSRSPEQIEDANDSIIEDMKQALGRTQSKN